MRTVNIGLVGLGTIGKGVYDAVVSNGDLISRRTGLSLVIKGVCDKDKKALESVGAGEEVLKTACADDLIGNKDIDIIVELIGGVTAAKDVVLNALRNKKHVVTANKALLSKCWKEIFTVASENEVFVNFEASVGGAIPVIRTLRESFVADNINTVYGILNGTTNFILTRMSENGRSFSDALKVAQEKGIAEKDPELDISGKDSAHKLAILSRISFGMDISPDDIYTEGIANIGPEDLKNAAKMGYSLKLLAIAKDTPYGLQLRVHPTLLRSSHLLSDVRGEDNAVYIKGDLIGESLLFGKGAGRKPTSSAVLGDIVGIGKHIAFVGDENTLPCRMHYAPEDKQINRMEELRISYYLRFSVIDNPGVLAGISSILAENNISIASVSQEERKKGEKVPVVIITHKAREGSMREAIGKIDTLEYVSDKTVVVRIEE
ncbi:MAG: homoserine dehydrogenase [Candidatus Omnitrophota bacterium]